MAFAQPTAHTFDSPTLRIAYERRGPATAPVALLLHGFPDDLRTWDATAEQLVAAGYQTLAPTMRGCGGSIFLGPGLGGGDQPNALSLVQIEAAGPRLLWRREPPTWEPEAVRWVTPSLAILRRRHANADGSLADDAPVSYVQLPLPR
jgi:pimeloyl-ACP methyl ester carboxylesterase